MKRGIPLMAFLLILGLSLDGCALVVDEMKSAMDEFIPAVKKALFPKKEQEPPVKENGPLAVPQNQILEDAPDIYAEARKSGVIIRKEETVKMQGWVTIWGPGVYGLIVNNNNVVVQIQKMHAGVITSEWRIIGAGETVPDHVLPEDVFRVRTLGGDAVEEVIFPEMPDYFKRNQQQRNAIKIFPVTSRHIGRPIAKKIEPVLALPPARDDGPLKPPVEQEIGELCFINVVVIPHDGVSLTAGFIPASVVNKSPCPVHVKIVLRVFDRGRLVETTVWENRFMKPGELKEYVFNFMHGLYTYSPTGAVDKLVIPHRMMAKQ